MLSFSTATPPDCPVAQLSCHNTTIISSCCLLSPGGQLLQTQFWDSNLSTDLPTSWTIHGLWPDNCDGTYLENCDSFRAYKNISAILQAAGDSSLVDYMQTYWISNDETAEKFWENEWSEHGTCVSTLNPTCYTQYQPQEEVVDYFTKVVSLFKSLETYQVSRLQTFDIHGYEDQHPKYSQITFYRSSTTPTSSPTHHRPTNSVKSKQH